MWPRVRPGGVAAGQLQKGLESLSLDMDAMLLSMGPITNMLRQDNRKTFKLTRVHLSLRNRTKKAADTKWLRVWASGSRGLGCEALEFWKQRLWSEGDYPGVRIPRLPLLGAT